MTKTIKIYGTARIQRGEKRYLRKGKYYTSARDKKGHFISTRKWTPKQPNIKEIKQKIEEFAEIETGKEAKEKITEKYEEYPEWEDFNVLS